MQIEFSQSGGLAPGPGPHKPVRIDVERLTPDLRQRLQQLVAAAHFFDLPATVGRPKADAADPQHTRLTIEDSGRQHSVKVLLPCEDAALQALLQAVQVQVRVRAKAERRPGGP